MLAALAADAPEITAAVTALSRRPARRRGRRDRLERVQPRRVDRARGDRRGHIALHPRVIELAGAVALWIAASRCCSCSACSRPLAALVLVLAMFLPYVVLLGVRHDGWRAAAAAALGLAGGGDHRGGARARGRDPPRRGGRRDALLALAGTAVVVGASIAMERSASKLGRATRFPGSSSERSCWRR